MNVAYPSIRGGVGLLALHIKPDGAIVVGA